LVEEERRLKEEEKRLKEEERRLKEEERRLKEEAKAKLVISVKKFYEMGMSKENIAEIFKIEVFEVEKMLFDT
jgi:hypothetical protein